MTVACGRLWRTSPSLPASASVVRSTRRRSLSARRSLPEPHEMHGPGRLLQLRGAGSDSCFSAFPGADPHGFLDVHQPDFAVSGVTGIRGGYQDVNYVVG